MTMLWLVFMVLIIVSIGVVLLPFLRQGPDKAPLRADYDIAIYRSQLAEIDQEIERGLLTPDQADAARAEVHRRMLAAEDAEVRDPAARPRPDNRRFRLAAVVALVVVLPLGSVGLYGVLGSPNLPGEPYAWRLTHDPELVSASAADKLASQLQLQPSADGYKHLAEMYLDARDFDKAAEAGRRAVALGATDSDTWSELGEAIVMVNGGAVVPEAMTAFTNSLGVDAANPRSRFYIGLAESQIGNLREAVAIWRDLERNSDPSAPWRSLVEAHIAAIARQGGFDPATVPPAPPSVQSLTASLNAMSDAMQAQAAAGGQPAQPGMPAPGSGQDTFIRTMVDRLAAQMQADPNDVAGWQRLSHAYTVLGEHDKALAAAERAVHLKPDDAGVQMTLAEAQKAANPQPANDSQRPVR
jgi:cytochrome c-type biogenesis protein CcmH